MFLYEDNYFIFDNPKKKGIKNKIKKIVAFIMAVYYKIQMNICHPQYEKKKDYDVVICAIFKNEAAYLKEWIEYHKIIGIQHIYLYNNNSEDNYLPVLQAYIDCGYITLVDWPYNQAQMQAYQDCINKYRNKAQWIGFIDIDEFIVPKTTNNIYDFLKRFEKNRGSVIIYWKLFGTSGMTERDINKFVTEDFYICWKKHCDIGKCFYNTNYEFEPEFKHNPVFHHSLWSQYKGRNLPPVNVFDKVCIKGYNFADNLDFPIQINHYFTKSYKEYVQKSAKGDVYFEINPHDREYFYRHEMKCEAADYSIYKYLVKLKLEINDNRCMSE